MDQLIVLLEKSFTSSDNQELNDLLEYFLTICYESNFYESLQLIIQDESIDSNIKIAGIICFKNVIQYRWENLPQSIHQEIIEMFFETIIHLQEPFFICHTMHISNLLIDKNLIEIDWANYIYDFIEDDPITSLILTRSLIYQYQKKDISELLTDILSFIFTKLQEGDFDPLFLKISLKIIQFSLKITRHSIPVINFDEEQLNFLLQFMMETFSEDHITQYIKIFTKIASIKPCLLYEMEEGIVTNIVDFLNMPKVSIHFFELFSNFASDDKLWELFEGNFIEFFLPFFSIEDENELDNPIQFINDHYFDSFSSQTDPKSAAFSCLEFISRARKSVIHHIIEKFKTEFESHSDQIYSISHVLSAVLANFDYANSGPIAIELFNYAFQFIQSDSILIQCAVLIVLQFERFLDRPIEEHVHGCIELIFDSNELVQYFSMNVLLNVVPYFNDGSILQNFQDDSIVSKILDIAQKFEFPQMTDLLHVLFRDRSYLNQITPSLIDIVNSTFSFAQFYSENNSNYSISSILFTILTLIVNLKDSSPSEFEICKLSFINCIEMISSSLFVKPSLLCEVIFTSLFYSPENFEEMWDSFDVLLPFLDDRASDLNELIFKIFALICFNDREGMENKAQLVLDVANKTINVFEVFEFAPFIATLAKFEVLNEDSFSTLVCKICLAWENDVLNFFDDVFELLAVLFNYCAELFIEIFDDKFHVFLDDVINCAETKYLMLISPLVFQFLNDKQKVICLSLGSDEGDEEEEEFLGENCGFPLPIFSLFSDSEIVENYQSFVSQMNSS